MSTDTNFKKTIQLKIHQKILYELLNEVDNVCKRNNIKYMLFAGTALGAVRHNDIIPWDDDLDIVMLREDYNKFLKLAPNNIDTEKYFIQPEFSEHWPMFFSKLRKNNTACLERVIPKDKKMHQGIYIDIFPCDNLSDNGFIRKIQFCASKIVIAKSLFKRGYLTDSLLKKIFMFISLVIPQKIMVRIVQLKNNSNSKYVHTFFGAASKYEKNIFPREWMTETVMMKFGEKNYPVSAYYDEMLKKLYGDYMTPPSKEDRNIKVHAELIDTENSYEAYLEEQKSYKFDVYTRSIR